MAFCRRRAGEAHQSLLVAAGVFLSLIVGVCRPSVPEIWAMVPGVMMKEAGRPFLLWLRPPAGHSWADPDVFPLSFIGLIFVCLVFYAWLERGVFGHRWISFRVLYF